MFSWMGKDGEGGRKNQEIVETVVHSFFPSIFQSLIFDDLIKSFDFDRLTLLY